LREIPEFDSGGNPVLDPLTGEQLLINEGFLVSFDEVFIQKRATVNWSIRTRKTNSNISVFIERRAFESNDFEDRVKGSSLRWSWNISRKNLFSANMSLRKTQRVASDDTYRTILTSFRRSLAPNATASISLSRLQRLGAAVNNTYTVNTISATFNMNW
ncbi:MAG: hypothetical protein GXP18_10110, partial [Gammaproteobacteria bacterium]|nr:hypothetical protein [Gammaproteobacteria bacterium]